MAVIVTGAPTTALEPEMGAVIEIDGREMAVTLTLIGLDLTTTPLLSVASATITWVPAGAAVQVVEYGKVVSMIPLCSSSTRNLTETIEAGADTVAVAVNVTVELPVKDAPAVGPVKVTTGPITFTLEIDEVAVAPDESVTRAEIAKIPGAVGVHVAE